MNRDAMQPDDQAAEALAGAIHADVFDHVIQFSFLIDGAGVIDARIGSTRELSTVTGTPSP